MFAPLGGVSSAPVPPPPVGVTAAPPPRHCPGFPHSARVPASCHVGAPGLTEGLSAGDRTSSTAMAPVLSKDAPDIEVRLHACPLGAGRGSPWWGTREERAHRSAREERATREPTPRGGLRGGRGVPQVQGGALRVRQGGLLRAGWGAGQESCPVLSGVTERRGAELQTGGLCGAAAPVSHQSLRCPPSPLLAFGTPVCCPHLQRVNPE